MQWKQTFALLTVAACLLSGCAPKNDAAKLDPKNPVTIEIWHYYNGSQKNGFDELIQEFNDTVGREQGIIAQSHNQGDVGQLEKSVLAAAKHEVGSKEVPNIFASYADTAYAVEKMGLLADLDQYFTPEEQAQYVDFFLEEGRIGNKGELKIFPTAKSTEVIMINKTDWEKFAQATGASLDEFATKEGVVRLAENYYHWTDGLTPDLLDDGKSFYGRDALANLFIIGTRQLDCELFVVQNGKVTIQLDKEVIRKIWDVYYIPFIKGYFAAYGKFRSDDAKVGSIIALTGSTSSASYFPTQVTTDDGAYPIEALVLPTPIFESGQKYAVQQGAGMVVAKSDPRSEKASVEFLKWFTDAERNLKFSAASGYMPVKKDAIDPAKIESTLQTLGIEIDSITHSCLQVSLETARDYELYTNKAFENGSAARKVLEYDLSDKAKADRQQVLDEMAAGKSRAEAIALFDNDENFETWYAAFSEKLTQTVLLQKLDGTAPTDKS